MSELTGASTTATKPRPPPPGVYVPAVCFFNENDDLDIPAIKAHVLRLAEVRLIFFTLTLREVFLSIERRKKTPLFYSGFMLFKFLEGKGLSLMRGLLPSSSVNMHTISLRLRGRACVEIGRTHMSRMNFNFHASPNPSLEMK